MMKVLSVFVILAALLVSVQLVAANGSPNFNGSSNNGANLITANPYAVNVMYNSGVGNYLVDSTGYTLYMYNHDQQGSGSSSCYGECASIWPVFYNANMYYPPSLPSYNFGVINRTDGTKQLTYKGYPLYLYAGDSKPGQINGNEFQGFVVATPSGPYSASKSTTTTTTNTTSPKSNTTAVGIAGNVQRSAQNSSNNASTTTTTTTTSSQSSGTAGGNNLLRNIGIVVVILVVIGLAYFLMRRKH